MMVRFTDIVDWYEGRLDPERSAIVQRAVDEGDERTCTAVRWLQNFNQTAASMRLSTPPPTVRQNLRRAFSDWAGTQPVDRHTPREVVAALIFDSRQGMALAGARSGGDDETLHLAFASDEADVMIDLVPIAQRRFRIEGQVLPVDTTTAPVFEAVAVVGEETFRAVDNDQFGRFTFEDVPASISELIAENDDLRVTLHLDPSS